MVTFREIHEMMNALFTYELYQALGPFKVKDLLRAHFLILDKWTPLFADLALKIRSIPISKPTPNPSRRVRRKAIAFSFVEFSLAEILHALEHDQG